MLFIKPEHKPKFKILGPLSSPVFEPCIAMRNSYNVLSDDFAFCLCLVFSDSFIYLEGPARGQLWHTGGLNHALIFNETDIKEIRLSHQFGQDPTPPVSMGMLYNGTNDSKGLKFAS